MFTSTPFTSLLTSPKEQPLGRNARRKLFHARRNLQKQPWPCKLRLYFGNTPNTSGLLNAINTSSMVIDVGSGDSGMFEVTWNTIDLVTPEVQAFPSPVPSPIQEYPKEVWEIIKNPANLSGQVWNVVVTTTYVVTRMVKVNIQSSIKIFNLAW